MSPPIVGIDLGTTCSCIAVYRNDKVEVIPSAEGHRITPSYVAFTETDLLVGEAAKNQDAINPENTVFNVKRLIGRRFDDPVVQKELRLWPFKVVNEGDKLKIQCRFKGKVKSFFPEEISAMVLSTLKDSAEAYLGKPVCDAVITVPAYFNDSQRQATKDAGKIAGLNVRRIINEPTAGALAFGIDKTEEEERNVLMFDLGGGTFDVSILSVDSGIFEVRAVNGISNLGGEDFDTRLVEYCVEEFTRKYGLDLSSDKKALRRLRSACEYAKRMLSSATNTSIVLDVLHGGKDFQTAITRARFEEVNQDLFQKIQDVLPNVLRDAMMSKEDIDEVVLIGGSTRIPYVQQMVKAFFGKEPSKTVNPDEAVACGAAIQAILTADRDPSVILPEIVLVDVAHLSLGIKQFGDTMSVIIKRNTTIPIKKTERYSTAVDNQTVIPISVYEGENHIASYNNLLGEFTMSGFPRLPRGQAKVYVTFEIDADGILHVTAVNDVTKNSKQLSITTNKGRLSQEEISRLVREAENRNRDTEARREAEQARNELEGLCIRVRDKAESLLKWLAIAGDKAKAEQIAAKQLELELVLKMSNLTITPRYP